MQNFFSSPAFCVVGASLDRAKFGNKVLRCLKKEMIPANKYVYPVHPKEEIIEGLPCLRSPSELIGKFPGKNIACVFVTPPAVTLNSVQEALNHGIKQFWMQPGSEHPQAVALIQKDPEATLFANGACVLVELGFSEHAL